MAGVTADFVFSSAMDLQMKLANDGYALAVVPDAARDWPDGRNWQDTAYALTFEPAVLVYHRPQFPDGPPQSRLALMDWLRVGPAGAAVRWAPMTSKNRRWAICSLPAMRSISPISGP
jgi:iron(III) transport system substrate-binding protein